MNSELPYLKSIYATIQREEICMKVMSHDTNSNATTTHVYHVKSMPRSENLNSSMSDYLSPSWQAIDGRTFKEKRLDLKSSYCHNTRHLTNHCWQLHPEIKPRFAKEQRGYQRWPSNYKSNLTNHLTENFTANLVALIQDFANYLQDKHNYGKMQNGPTGK
jgi:hypothetical protein